MSQLQKSPGDPGVLGKIFGLVFAAILLVLGFMFSVVLLTIVATVGLAVWGYFWWKTRALRKVMRERPPMPAAEGQVIEGEVIVVEEHSGRGG